MRRDQSSIDGEFVVSCVVPLQASASALHAAADRCDLEGVEWALAAGTDPSTREAEHGLTPLSLACGGASANCGAYEGDERLACVIALLRAGASTGRATWDGFAPLHYAASKDAGICDQLRIIDELLDAGADVCQRNDAGWAPVHYAAEAGNLELVRRFIQAGADVKSRNPAGFLTECHRRAWPAVLKAGYPVPQLRHPGTYATHFSWDLVHYLRRKKPDTFRYLERIGRYESFAKYEAAQLAKFVKLLKFLQHKYIFRYPRRFYVAG
jgi:hypothetical protein